MIVLGIPRKTRRDFVKTELRQDGNAIKGLLPVDRNIVAERFERLAREGFIDALGLLQARNVRFAFLEPGNEGIDPLLDRIDVPGRDSHPLSAPFRGWHPARLKDQCGGKSAYGPGPSSQIRKHHSLLAAHGPAVYP